MRHIIVLSFVLLLAAPPGALARGVLVSPEDLDPAARDSLRAEIDAARSATPEAFQRFVALRARVPEIDTSKRGRLPAFLPSLIAMGPDGLLPMLQEIAFDAPERGDLVDTAWLGWRASLLEAVGKLRDPRAAPVLKAVVAHGPAQLLITSAAAAAVGKLLSDEAAGWLVEALAASEGERRLGILRGLGSCRRIVAVEALAAALRARPPAGEAHILAKSLGDAGSSWAWRTPVVAASGEEDAVRREAARALAEVWPAYEGQAQKKIGHALLVVDHPDTAALLRGALESSTAATMAAGQKLIDRFNDKSFRGN
ncbi:MAG: hypothetical protein ABIK09_00840 [Pseudomonadota bacterium]